MRSLNFVSIGSLAFAFDDNGKFFALALWIPARQGQGGFGGESIPVLLASSAKKAPEIDGELMRKALERSPRVRKLMRDERT